MLSVILCVITHQSLYSHNKRNHIEAGHKEKSQMQLFVPFWNGNNHQKDVGLSKLSKGTTVKLNKQNSTNEQLDQQHCKDS